MLPTMNLPTGKVFKENILPGLTVGLVSIPLSLALAIASGATPLQGMITAIWAGLIGALFGGSRFNIIGPTGAIAGLLMGYASGHGASALPHMALLVGLIILIFYALRWYKYIIYIPVSVIHGFTLGVALILCLSQINFAFGLRGLSAGESLLANVRMSVSHLGEASGSSASLFVLALVFLFASRKWIPRIPGAVVVAAAGILIGYLSSHDYLPCAVQTLADLYEHFSGSLFTGGLFSFSFSLFDRAFWNTCVAVTVIAILETLISARIANEMTGVRFSRKKEMIGLGLANLASGICGGLPATAALARTALNVRSGATHFSSAMASSFFVAVVSLALFGYFKYLPLAAIAAILVSVAVNMVEWHMIVSLWQIEKASFFILVLVAGLTVGDDPMIGIMAGTLISLLRFLQTIARSHAEITVHSYSEQREISRRFFIAEYLSSPQAGQILVYRFAGEITYITAPVHLEYLGKIQGGKSIILSFRNLYFVDLDGMNYLRDMVTALENNGQRVYFTGLHTNLVPIFEHNSFYRQKVSEQRVFTTASQAIEGIRNEPSIPVLVL